MTFRTTSSLAAFVCAALSAVLLVVPSLIFWLFQLDANIATEVFARRASVLFLGLSLMIFGLRDLPNGPAQKSVARAIALMMAALAVLGAVEFVLGRVGPGIVLAILTELAFVALFVRNLRAQ